MKLLIVDDHQMFVDGLVTSLKTKPDVCINVQHDANEAIAHLESGHIYNLILLDLNMPNLDGFSFMDALVERDLHFPIAILSGNEDVEDFIRLRKYTIAGFIPKKSSIEQLYCSLQKMLAGEQVFPEEYAQYFDAYEADTNNIDFSERKKQILKGMDQGYSNQEIAEQLFITKNTVKSHIREIYILLQVNSRIECLNKAKLLDLI